MTVGCEWVSDGSAERAEMHDPDPNSAHASEVADAKSQARHSGRLDLAATQNY